MKIKYFYDKEIKAADIKLFHKSFQNYNAKFVKNDNYIPVNYAIYSDKKNIIGGIIAGVYWNWLTVDRFFLYDKYRNPDLMTELWHFIENIAIKYKIYNISTKSLLKPEQKFLVNYGFKISGMLENRPPGFNCYYLEKKIEKTHSPNLVSNFHIEPINKEDTKIVIESGNKFNEEKFNKYPFYNYQIIMKDAQTLVGGITGYIGWRWQYIDILWVSEEYRGLGLGSSLLKKSEKIALGKNVVGIFLGTTDFQAKAFYLNHGYKIFAIKKNFPKGYNNYSMKKMLKNNKKNSLKKGS